jgi:3-oxoacyl-[acyl-carrier protein] reductase
MFDLTGRSALVTGAGGGIGAAVAQAYAEAGAAVLVADIDEAAAKSTADRIRASSSPEGAVTAGAASGGTASGGTASGGVAEAFAFDVRDADGAAEAARRAAALGGGTLHILVNNAGAIAPAMFGELTEEAFRRIVDIHLVGSFVCSQAVLPYLPEDGTGRIINVTSAAGLQGTIGQANYGAAKAGIVGLTKSLAKELARRHVTVNAIAPLAATPMTENIRGNEKLAAKTLARIPLGRWAEPAEIAGSFVYFASDAASYVTGQVLPVDGGTVM